jgi:hypothetical protein
MESQNHSENKSDGLLINYEVFVRDLPELAADWQFMDPEERSHHQVVLMEIWSKRRLLGQLYQTQQLVRIQEARLAYLDQLLLEHASLMEKCFSFDLARLLTIFRWGTPLAQSTQLVRLETAATSLNQIAQALAVPA